MAVTSNDVQKLFLQAILSRRILSQKLAAKIWEKCIEAVRGAPHPPPCVLCGRPLNTSQLNALYISCKRDSGH